MTIAQTGKQYSQKPLRVWPGVLVVSLQWVLWFGLPIVRPEAIEPSMYGGLLGGLAVVLWWVFFSRAPWLERLGGVALMIIALFGTFRLLHVSIATAAMGMLFPMFAIPSLSLAFVIGAVAARRFSAGSRRATLAAAILVGSGMWTLLRTGGVSGGFQWDFKWRWAQTSEERLLAQIADEPTAPAPSSQETEPRVVWPGFRGPGRDGVIRGVRIETDWSASPPVELWRRPVGPGWSSFAVRGDLVYTQEQRGEDEVVACYNAGTGEPVWLHSDKARFWEANAGAGPRGTPTLKNGRVYTFGATGILNALDANSGDVVWSRNALSDTEKKTPGWGFASSPLVVDDVVIVAVSGQLVAYDSNTGSPRWFGPAGGTSYGSPHLATIDGVTQILLLSGNGVTSVAPADGAVLWEHPWQGFHSLQPALTDDGEVLLSAGGMAGGMGTRRLAVANGSGKWTVQERWTSIGLKPYFNDSVVHKGHAYGFDGRILSCIDLAEGQRKWKGGRYGNGQLILLADQDLLLVLSEEGDLALVKATPDQFTELARLKAIEGKSWNHPALAGDLLLVRNSQEMAAFRLTLAGR